MCNVEMIRLVLEKKVQSDDSKMMKFMISFGALYKLVSEEVGQPACLYSPLFPFICSNRLLETVARSTGRFAGSDHQLFWF